MEFEKLSESIENLLNRLKESEAQVVYLRQRESKLLASNTVLQEQIDQAQTNVQQIISRLKSVEAEA